MPSPRERRLQALRDGEEYVRRHIWALEDAAAKTLYTAYQAAYARLGAALLDVFARQVPGDAWTAQDALFRARTESLMAQIEAEADGLQEEGLGTAYRASVAAYRAGFYGRGWLLDQGLLGGAATLPLLPAEAVRAAVLQPYVGSTFLDRFKDARDEFVRRVRRAIVGSQIEGEGIRQARLRLAAELGIDASKRTNPGYYARTEMIARTEILRSSNLGAQAVYEANRDVITAWEFIATKDERTCPECGPLDGNQYPLGEGPQPPLHPNCRCSVLPVLADAALSDAIAGKRETYSDWANRRGVGQGDGGVFAGRGRAAPQSQTVAAQQAAGA